MLLKNCKIINNDNNGFITVDILIENNIIKKIKKDIPNSENSDNNIINIKNNIVLEGIIDSHVHFRYGNEKKEGFKSGSEGAKNGGIPFVIDMPNNNSPTTTIELFNEKYNKCKKYNENTNIELNYGITNNNYLDVVPNAKSYKIFMVKSVGDLFITDYSKLKNILNQNKLFTIHCEHKDVILENSKKYKLNSWKDHFKIRDKNSEIKAIEEILKNLKIIDKLNQSRPHIHILHLSTKEGLELINNAKKTFKNVKLTTEVCPHHLLLNVNDAEKLKGLGKFNPPLRTKEDNKALINGLINKSINVVATDHAPHTIEEKTNSVENCPSGIPGIETLVPLMLNLVNKKIISIFDFNRLLVKNPSNIYNINNKLKEGNRANLSIINLNKEHIIKGENFKSKAKFTPFENWEVKGIPTYVVVNGNIHSCYDYENKD